jgi:hypothetical protein
VAPQRANRRNFSGIGGFVEGWPQSWSIVVIFWRLNYCCIGMLSAERPLARTLFDATIEQWNADPWLLNTPGGWSISAAA